MIESLSQTAELWSLWMWRGLVGGSWVCLLALALWLPFRKRAPAQLGYGLFLLVLLKLIVPLEIALPQWLASVLPATWLTLELSPVLSNSAASSAELGRAFPSVNEVQSAQSPQTFLFVAWALIAGALLFRLAWIQTRTANLARSSRPIENGELPVDFDELQRLAGMRQAVRFLASDRVHSPAAGGLFRPYVLLPMELCRAMPREPLSWVLLHELAHLRRFDLWVSLLQRLVQVVFFFHPAVWLANWIVDEQREFACDEFALRISKAPRRDCGEGFLSIVEWSQQHHQDAVATLGMFDSKSVIRRRLMRILNGKGADRSLGARLCTALVVVMGLLVLPTPKLEAAAPQDPARAREIRAQLRELEAIKRDLKRELKKSERGDRLPTERRRGRRRPASDPTPSPDYRRVRTDRVNPVGGQQGVGSRSSLPLDRSRSVRRRTGSGFSLPAVPSPEYWVVETERANPMRGQRDAGSRTSSRSGRSRSARRRTGSGSSLPAVPSPDYWVVETERANPMRGQRDAGSRTSSKSGRSRSVRRRTGSGSSLPAVPRPDSWVVETDRANPVRGQRDAGSRSSSKSGRSRSVRRRTGSGSSLPPAPRPDFWRVESYRVNPEHGQLGAGSRSSSRSGRSRSVRRRSGSGSSHPPKPRRVNGRVYARDIEAAQKTSRAAPRFPRPPVANRLPSSQTRASSVPRPPASGGTATGRRQGSGTADGRWPTGRQKADWAPKRSGSGSGKPPVRWAVPRKVRDSHPQVPPEVRVSIAPLVEPSIELLAVPPIELIEEPMPKPPLEPRPLVGISAAKKVPVQIPGQDPIIIEVLPVVEGRTVRLELITKPAKSSSKGSAKMKRRGKIR